MDEQNPAARAVDLITARPPTRAPFDPASLLDGRQPPPPAHAPGPTVVVVREFDPATFLGDRALRGAFNLVTVKPLVTTIGGVEMVTVPASAYAYALRHAAAQELPEEDVEQAGPVPNSEGCMGLLIRLHEGGTLSIGQLVEASGLDHLDVGDRIAAYRAMVDGNAVVNATLSAGPYASPVHFTASPEAARVELTGVAREAEAPEGHAAALDDGGSDEAHGAALDGAKSDRHPRRTKSNREIP
ncbi:hypothetical protein [Lichenibacterium ramalinae]|uniref:Uncharacterized protein n=1 Tax=Lichenibacterium ramalinae TaxID=2316527 RepID=A0A4Q2R8H1_9HYPH|nr:hypothetical protein [Lichenibacterium ramalinae]RYB02029.1 hypothetical protein D3272_22955 [Lichenibacterium ramalinae]